MVIFRKTKNLQSCRLEGIFVKCSSMFLQIMEVHFTNFTFWYSPNIYSTINPNKVSVQNILILKNVIFTTNCHARPTIVRKTVISIKGNIKMANSKRSLNHNFFHKWRNFFPHEQFQYVCQKQKYKILDTNKQQSWQTFPIKF